MKVFLLLIFLSVNLLQSQTPPNNTLYAGTSKISITQHLSNDYKFNSLNDSLFIKTVLLKNNRTKIALITLDTQGVPQFIRDEVDTALKQDPTLSNINLTISATHTHSGIIIHPSPIKEIEEQQLTETQKELVNLIIKSIKKANLAMEPIEIAWGKFEKPEYVFNRRWYMKNEQINPFGESESVTMNPKFNDPNILTQAGPTDPEVVFFVLKSITKQEPIAIFANYSLHYVGGVEENYLSADYFGYFDNYLNEMLRASKKTSEQILVIMSNGTSGDVNNHNYSKPYQASQPYEQMQKVAKDISTTLFNLYDTLNFIANQDLKIKETFVKLRVRKPNITILKNLDTIQKTTKNIFNSQEKYYAVRANHMINTYPTEIEIPIQLIQIGKGKMATIPFEVFAETGLYLKSKVTSEFYFTIGLANGHWGYLPTPKQFENGGYETWFTVSRFQEDTSDLITKIILNL